MSGNSGSRTAVHTPTVSAGGKTFAVTVAQRRLIDRALNEGGSTHVMGAEVRSARALSIFGDLSDQGRLGPGGNGDGERWIFELKADVR